MPGRRIEMRKLKEVLRLRLTARLSNRKIALCTGVGKSAVSRHVGRAEELGLESPRIESMAEEAVEALLYPPFEEPRCPARPRRSAPRAPRPSPTATALMPIASTRWRPQASPLTPTAAARILALPKPPTSQSSPRKCENGGGNQHLTRRR